MSTESAIAATYAANAESLMAMQNSMTLPLLLHDAVALKEARGDTDIAAFKLVAREFGSGLNATVGGALDAMRQWTRKGCVQRTPAVEAFICDLQAIETGVFGRAAALPVER
jgi:hypothetical protein